MTTKNWYQRIDVMAVDSLAAKCPRCSSPYPVGPIFDKDPRTCLYCHATLVEWNLIHYIYVIDLDNSPHLVQHMVNYLRLAGSLDAEKQLFELLEFLGVKAFNE